ncbi:GNAT family N-acetyltransferase [Vibrio cyclitrophicus]
MIDPKKHTQLLNQVFRDWGDERFLFWKYSENPFGESIVEQRIIDEEVVSIRYLMRWEMKSHKGKYNCFQATDSATAVSQRGMGHFSHLTNEAINKIDDGFIFNFPNENSKGIYLKLGWKLESVTKSFIAPTLNFFLPRELSFQSEILYTDWDNERLTWRLSNGKQYKRFTINQRVFVYKDRSFSSFVLADIICTPVDMEIGDFKLFLSHLRKEGYVLFRYVGFGTRAELVIDKSLFFKCKVGRGVNLVSYNKPPQFSLRAEMIDTDYT